MKKVFVAGRRFDKMKNVCVLANSAVVFSFYFIYRYLFEPSYPDFVGAPLVAIFLLIEAVIIVLTNKVGAKIKAKIRYEIKPEYLEMSTGKTVQRFPWANFTEAKFNPYRMRDVFAVSFIVGGQELVINQYVEDIYGLVHQILKHTDMKKIDPEVINRANTFR